MDEGSSGRNSDKAAELVAAVRSSRVLWAAVVIPLSLLALMAVVAAALVGLAATGALGGIMP